MIDMWRLISDERTTVVSSKSTCGSPGALATTSHLRKKATLASGPKFREETPKKGEQYGNANRRAALQKIVHA